MHEKKRLQEEFALSFRGGEFPLYVFPGLRSHPTNEDLFVGPGFTCPGLFSFRLSETKDPDCARASAAILLTR